jgi:hypothetical protein
MAARSGGRPGVSQAPAPALTIHLSEQPAKDPLMQSQLIAILILLPITVVILLAGIHEFRRYKSEGRANYGLAYDEKTGTTYVTGIADDEEAFDPEDFDPSSYDELKAKREEDESDETGETSKG